MFIYIFIKNYFMYLTKSLMDGLKILGFDKDTIKSVSRERSLEEIFLSTLFLNYIIVLIVYTISVSFGGVYFEGKPLNMSVVYGLLMVYPFVFNLCVYLLYGFFGIMAEMLDKRKKIEPLMSVGFHTAIVYTIVFYIIALSAIWSMKFALLMIAAFLVFFIYVMFNTIITIYKYSFGQALIVLFVPFVIIGLLLLGVFLAFPNAFEYLIVKMFA